ETRIATSGAQAVFVSTSILNDNISWSIYATLKYSTGPQANPYLMVTPDDIPFLPDAGRKASLTVNTNTTWKAVAEKPWISLSPSSGSGNETVEVTVDTLMSNQTRTGKVTFTAAGITPQTVTLTQEAARLTLSGNAFPIGYAAGSTVTFSISGNTSWTINTGQPWLSASLVSGKGNAVIVLTAQANKEPGNRTATVTVSGTGLEPQTITVTQSLNTGMSDHEKAEITVYPNPFTNEFRVSGLKNTAVFSLSDVSGKLLLYRKLNFDELITAGSIPAGFYIIRILTPRESWEGKIIKK
ncbi:MAG TPA: BACON domain-containing carbohydrate-binding protein, partial [Prolixibacteraceae bacterium]|nr:BACON domain-containing carbohydrate-binding protein [Prolixibacteraceae bacterium]